jgi:LDH2 family malate/lactate/ureidoglycolate dehydrogenase
MITTQSPKGQSSTPTGASHDAPENSRISIPVAIELCQRALQRAGYTSEQSAIITDHLVDAELRGHPFAGLARALSIIDYLKSNPSMQPQGREIELTRDGPAFAHLDGNDSVGYLVAQRATQMAIDKAKATGVSVVGASGLWYSGNLAYYSEMAAQEGLVTFIASNGTPIVAPHGGTEAKFCTNPFCIGFPTSDRNSPVIWDIGTSNIMYAQVKLAERLGTSLPEGSAVDKEGHLTTNPLKVMEGALTVWGGHKGSGLAMMVQLLGIVAGSSEPTPFLSGFGFLIVAFDPSVLQPLDRVQRDADRFCENIRASKMLPGYEPARMPYERSTKRRREAKERGWFTVPEEVIRQLQGKAD